MNKLNSELAVRVEIAVGISIPQKSLAVSLDYLRQRVVFVLKSPKLVFVPERFLSEQNIVIDLGDEVD